MPIIVLSILEVSSHLSLIPSPTQVAPLDRASSQYTTAVGWIPGQDTDKNSQINKGVHK